MRVPAAFRVVAHVLFATVFFGLSAQAEPPPSLLNYQGRLLVDQANFNGAAYFKFALVARSSGATTNYWSHDGTTSGEPASAVSLEVSKGLYSALLGDLSIPNMTAPIPPSVFANSEVWLRVWVSTSGQAGSFKMLTPDQRIASVGYALMAAQVPDGSITAEKLAESVVVKDSKGGIQVTRVVSETFAGNGAELEGLNASAITGGTLAEARLPATVVVQDGQGKILAGSVQAGEFLGGGSGLTRLNANELTQGTVPDSQLSSNVVLRDGSGTLVGTKVNAESLVGVIADAQLGTNIVRLGVDQVFTGSNVFSGFTLFSNSGNVFVGDTFTGNRFQGNGSGLTGLDASRITVGKLNDQRLSDNVVVRDIQGRVIVNAVQASDFSGPASGLRDLNASALSRGTVPEARLPGTVPKLNADQEFTGATVFSNPANRFAGNGAGLTQLDASNLETGTLADARLSTNVVIRDASGAIQGTSVQTTSLVGTLADEQLGTNVARLSAHQEFTGVNLFSGIVLLRNPTNVFTGDSFTGNRFVGNGSGLTGLNASQITSGTVADRFLSQNVVVMDAVGKIYVKSIQASDFSGVGANLKDLNASAISRGTLPVDRLPLSVARADRDQEFIGANRFTNPSNQFVGSGSGLTELDASKISSGTLADSRLSTNVVLRGSADEISASGFAGNGARLTDLAAQNVTSGTLSDARLSQNVPLLSASRTNVFEGINWLLNLDNRFAGDGAGLTNLAANKITSGTLSDSRLSANVPLLSRANAYSGANTFTNIGNRFVGDGSGLTQLSASNVTAGILPDARLSTNVAVRDSSGVLTASAFVGNGGRLTNLAAQNVTSGTLDDARLSPRVALLNRPNVFTDPGNKFAGDGSALVSLDATSLATGTVPDPRLSANVALLDRTGQVFKGANQFVHASNVFVGVGSGLIQLNASNITAGLLPDARLSANVLRISANGTFSSTNIQGTNIRAANFALPLTTGTNRGVLSLGPTRFLHAQGQSNTFVGSSAGNFSLSGGGNTAVGHSAMISLAGGDNNTAIGVAALSSTQGGANNVAIGAGSMFDNTSGADNVAVGLGALSSNTSGHENVAMGFEALQDNVSGNGNIAIGLQAGAGLVTGVNNILLGSRAQSPDESGTVRIGVEGRQTNTFIAGIYPSTVASGVAVHVDADGRLGVLSSSRRFKQSIRDMGDSSDVLLALRPVSFEYRPEIDPTAKPQFGLIAEEVEKVAPELVARDAQGQLQTVRYEAVNAMLLNEVQKQAKHIQQQEELIRELQAEMVRLRGQVAPTSVRAQVAQPSAKEDPPKESESLARVSLEQQVHELRERLEAMAAAIGRANSAAPEPVQQPRSGSVQ